jgi:ectoine hydroxylase-related dioxygenase (phytanoyl-CoA dioxygenase family)
METTVLAHVLTDTERDTFERDGYFFVENALASEQVRHFAAAVDDVDARERRAGRSGTDDRLNLHDAIGNDEQFLELIDWATTFPKVWGILGWNIQLYHTQMVVSPTLSTPPQNPRLGWHQDNNRMNRDMEVALQPRVSLKVLYFLSEMPEAGMGNFYVVPGSHTTRTLAPDPDGGPNPAGALAITAKAGDALIFDRRLWHAASPNTSPVTRKVLFYGYSYRWLRPKCDMQTAHLIERCDPIRRQLLGACTTANGYFDPQEDDVPLRAWMCRHLGSDRVPA